MQVWQATGWLQAEGAAAGAVRGMEVPVASGSLGGRLGKVVGACKPLEILKLQACFSSTSLARILARGARHGGTVDLIKKKKNRDHDAGGTGDTGAAQLIAQGGKTFILCSYNGRSYPKERKKAAETEGCGVLRGGGSEEP